MEDSAMVARHSAVRSLMLAALAVLLATLIAGCGAMTLTGDTGAGTGTATPTGPATASTSTPAGSGGQQMPPSGPQGALSVDVVAGPTCPVEQAEDPCPPAKVTDRSVTISTPAGAVVATVTTDAKGHFTIVLAPGDYVIQVAIVPGAPGMRQDSPGNVTVVAGQTTTVEITLDTGIR